MSKRQKRLHCFRPAQLQDLPRVAYGVWVGNDIRGACRGRRLPTIPSSDWTRKRWPRYGSRISSQASSSSTSPVSVYVMSLATW